MQTVRQIETIRAYLFVTIIAQIEGQRTAIVVTIPISQTFQDSIVVKIQRKHNIVRRYKIIIKVEILSVKFATFRLIIIMSYRHNRVTIQKYEDQSVKLHLAVVRWLRGPFVSTEPIQYCL